MLLNDLYEIVQVDEQSTPNRRIVNIKLDSAHAIFKGHFPSMPILPGVCQVQLCGELLQQAVSRKIRLKEASTIKFLSFINPNEVSTIAVDLSWEALENGFSLQATLSDPTKVYLKMRGQYCIESTVSNE